jgi:hypothetical protein
VVGVDAKFQYRADIKRDVSQGTDAYGQPIRGDVQTVAAGVPCYFWHRDEKVQDTNRDGVILTTVTYAAFQFTADVRDADVIDIYDRRGFRVLETCEVDGRPAREKRYRRVRLQKYHGTH